MSRIDEALRRARDGRLAEPQELGHTLQEYPYETRSGSDGDSSPVIGAEQLGAPVAAVTLAVEIPTGLTRQCRKIAAILQNQESKSAVKTVAFASAATGEGKTSAVLGVALTLTRTYSSRVLLVDADLCQPTLHEAIRIKQEPGLIDILSGERHKAPPIAVHSSLHVLLAGRASTQPATDLGSEKLRALLKQCAAHYDWVLVDTPAMSLLLDEANVLGRLTDGVVFVVGATTPFTTAERAMAMIGEGRILGTVLNGLTESSARP
jgi:Mrp family chromosome partitioning ATPase